MDAFAPQLSDLQLLRNSCLITWHEQQFGISTLTQHSPFNQYFNHTDTLQVVSKNEAILNIPEERLVALDASHRDMVRPSSTESSIYIEIRDYLKSILGHVRKVGPLLSPPVLPPPTSHIGPIATAPSVGFRSYIHMFRDNVLEEMQECSVSDLFTKTPKALLESLNDLNVEDALIWMHLPLNHTAWINVSTILAFMRRSGS